MQLGIDHGVSTYRGHEAKLFLTGTQLVCDLGCSKRMTFGD